MSSWGAEDRYRNWPNLTSQRPKLITAKAHSETGRAATNDSGNRDELERNAPVQERRPLDTYFQHFAHGEFMTGMNQRAAAAQIHSLAFSQVKLSAKRAVMDLQHDRITRFRPPLHHNQLKRRYSGIGHNSRSLACPVSAACSTWAMLPTRSAELKGFTRHKERRFDWGTSLDIKRTGKCESS